VAGLIVAAQLLACVAVTFALGGAGKLAPHWFYLPIVWAGARLGVPGALGTGLVASVLAGPIMPLDVSAGIPQLASDWISRGVFFVLIGLFVTLVLERSMSGLQRELDSYQLERELRQALREGQFRLDFQPVVDVRVGGIVGVEALLRWEHPRRGLVPPGEFIPLAEESDLMVPIGAWVLEEACRQAVGWRDNLELKTPFKVAVNLSARQLAHEGLVDQVSDVLHRTGLDPSWLCLEVTETALVRDLASSTEKLRALTSLGVTVAVDDFGTGYASLVYLRQLPVDCVKIDRSFVEGITFNQQDLVIVSSVISLAHSLGKVALAEGVETKEQLDRLAALGCDLAQGYYFDRPLPATAIHQLLTAGISDPAFLGSARNWGSPG
jgi:Amt family ammonium transporter